MKKTLLKILVLCVAVCSALCVFMACGESPISFKLNFIVDNEIVKTIDTTGNEKIALPNDPQKAGYTFDGWFWDKDTWEKPFTANSLLDVPLSSDMSVYAKFTKNHEHNDATSGIAFKTLSVDNDLNVYGKVANAKTTFSFINEVEVKGNASFVVSTDIYGIQQIPTKTVPIEIGDNTFYITETVGNNIRLFTVTVRRRPIYTVSFNTNGGTTVESQQVEEDSFTIEPTTTKAGYTFIEWDYNFDNPITNNTVITAGWTANIDTPYKVEYYLQNLEDDNYTLYETENLTGTTDTTATAEIKTYEHFTHTTISQSKESENINGNGTAVLKVYYTRNRYTIKLLAGNNVTLNRSYNDSYKYGYQIEEVTATFNNYLGYEWEGWYTGNELITEDFMMPSFTVDKSIDYIARATIKEEMANLNFTSTATTCNITGIKDETVSKIIVPDYVTAINQGAFSGCLSLQEMTIPFVGGSIKTKNDTYQYPLGYIFGTSSYTGGTKTKQYYYGSSPSSTTNTTYYIPLSLRKVTVTGGNILYGAFCSCALLTSVTIGNSVTSIGEYAFSGCTCEIEWGGNPSITTIGNYAFSGYKGICITIPDSVTSIGNQTFQNCNNLTSVVIGNSVTSIGNQAFQNCNSLTSVVIGNSVTSIGYSAFYNCSGLECITVSEGNTKYRSEGNCLIEKDTNTLILGCKNSVIPTDDSVTSIGYYAFSNCSGLTSITIPNSVTSIGYNAFSGCSSLTSVTIGNSVTSIGNYAFSGCSSLTSVTIGNSVTSIGEYAFYNCSSLTSIKFSDTTTWFRTDSSTNWQNKTGGTEMSVTSVSINATYFKLMYGNYYWYKL